MLESHEDWVGKVEFIGFSLNNEADKIIKEILKNNATSMKHYYFTNKGDDENCTLSCMNIQNKGSKDVPKFALLN